MNWTMPYPCRSRSDSVRRINMSSEPGNESFFCALRPIPRILSLQDEITRIKFKAPFSRPPNRLPQNRRQAPSETLLTPPPHGAVAFVSLGGTDETGICD